MNWLVNSYGLCTARDVSGYSWRPRFNLIMGIGISAGHNCYTFYERLKKMSKMYVGNLPWTATEDEITELFAAHGDVKSVKLINDRDTGKPRGFGFVEMASAEEAEAAIEALDGKEFGGRQLKINEAREKTRS